MTPEAMFDRAFEIAFTDRRNLTSFLNTVNEEQAQWKPPDGEWSILEGLEHLMLEEISFRQGILTGIRQAEATGVWNNTPENTWKMAAQAMRRREQGYAKAPDYLMPQGRWTFQNMGGRLQRDRELSREVLLPYRSRDLSRLIIYMSKLYGNLNVYDRIEFCGIHDALHQEQMERVMRAPGVS